VTRQSRASDDGIVERYLDALLVEMAGGDPREVRHLLNEVAEHLADATAEGLARGQSVEEAEADAVRRFGPVAGIAAGERRRTMPMGTVVRQCFSSGLLLAAIGAVAIGLSGVAAGILRAIGGPQFIAGSPSAGSLGVADCARWLAANPSARTCQEAATLDWADETVAYRVIVGLLGAAAFAAFMLMRRRWRHHGRWAQLPPVVVDTAATLLFGLSGLWLLGLGVDAVVSASGHGAGQWLSAAPVALVVGGAFAVRLLRDLRRPIGATAVWSSGG
jgi:hypothetical protein